MPNYSGITAAGRQLAESRMLDTFDVKVQDGWETIDGVEVPVYETLFTTPGRVKAPGVPGVSAREVGARELVVTTRELHIPWNAPAVPDGAVVVAVAVDDTTDPELLGAVLHVEGPAPGSQTTARRLRIREALT